MPQQQTPTQKDPFQKDPFQRPPQQPTQRPPTLPASINNILDIIDDALEDEQEVCEC